MIKTLHMMLPRSVAILLFVFSLGGPGTLQGAPPSEIDVAMDRVAAAMAEGVSISLHDAPRDERGLVMIVTQLDDSVIQTIQKSPEASFAFVNAVAARYPVSAGTKSYIADALVGLSQICADFPPTKDTVTDPHLLKLIQAFRQGVKAGVERHRLAKDA